MLLVSVSLKHPINSFNYIINQRNKFISRLCTISRNIIGEAWIVCVPTAYSGILCVGILKKKIDFDISYTSYRNIIRHIPTTTHENIIWKSSKPSENFLLFCLSVGVWCRYVLKFCHIKRFSIENLICPLGRWKGTKAKNFWIFEIFLT